MDVKINSKKINCERNKNEDMIKLLNMMKTMINVKKCENDEHEEKDRKWWQQIFENDKKLMKNEMMKIMITKNII